MFRKSLLIIVCLSPLLFNLVVGIPVFSDKDFLVRKEQKGFTETSRRCFWVANYNEYKYCLMHNPKLSGFDLIGTFLSKVNAVSSLFAIIVVVSISTNVALIIYFLIKDK